MWLMAGHLLQWLPGLPAEPPGQPALCTALCSGEADGQHS